MADEETKPKTLADLRAAENLLHERLAELNRRKLERAAALAAKEAADARLMEANGAEAGAQTAAGESRAALLTVIDTLLAQPGGELDEVPEETTAPQLLRADRKR